MTLRVTQKPGVGRLTVTYTESTQPTGLVLLGVTDTTASLRCNPSFPTDSTYIKAYRWYVNGAATVDSEGPSVTLTGLTQVTEYWVAVSAITSKSVESDQSDVLLVTTEATADPTVPATAPTQPTALTETASPSDYAAFRWTGSVSTDDYPLLGYKVSRDGSPGIPTTNLFWLDESVAPNTTYLYQVWAYTAGAESPKSSLSITTDAAVQGVFAFQPISVPTGYRASQTVPSWSIGTVNGQGTVTASIQSGSFPPGMVLQTDGTVGQTVLPANSRGTYNAVVAATDNIQTITVAIQIIVDYAILRFSPPPQASPSAVVGEVYGGSGLMVANGGDGVYALSLKAGTYCPSGLAESEVVTDVWQVVGTCTGVSGQTYQPTFTLTSGDGQSAEVTLTIAVQAVAPLPLDIVLDALPNFTVGVSYSTKNLTVSGALGTVTVTRSGSVPTGWTASTSQSGAGPTFAMFSGTATDGYGLSYSGTITASDAGTTPPTVKTIPYSVAGNPAVATGVTITMPTFTNAVPGSSYSKTVTKSGGTGPFYGNARGILPPGITVTPPATEAATSWTFTATDVGASGAGNTYAGDFVIFDEGQNNSTTAPWQIIVDPLSTAFVAPSQSNPLPDITFTGDTPSNTTYDIADYVDTGSATDLAVAVAWDDTAPAGVSVTVNDASATGNFTIDYNGAEGTNPQTTVTADYRLILSYTDPTGEPPVSDAEADWISRSTGAGVIFYDDLRSYANTAAMLAAATTGYNQTSPGYDGSQFLVELDTSSGITAGKCLKISTFDTAGQQGGGWGRNFSTPAVSRFYLQFAVWMDEASLFWVNLNGDPNKKIMNIESYGAGQIALTNANNLGFISAFVNGNTATRRKIATPYGNDWFNQSGIDTGSAATTASQYLRRYGPSRYIYNVLRDYGYKAAGGASNYVNRRGFPVPEPDALASGAIPFVMNGWTVIEAKVYNDFVTDANDIFKLFAAPYGSAPTKIIDNNPGGAGTIEGNTLGNTRTTIYRQFEALNYPTGRSPEPGYRDTQVQKYDQFIASTNWIPFPGHLTGTEP